MPAYESISRRRHAAMHNYAIMHIGAAYLSIHNSARVPSRQEKARGCSVCAILRHLRQVLVSQRIARISRSKRVFPDCGKGSSVLPKRLFCVTAKAVPASGKGFAAERNGLFRIVKSPKRHVRTLFTAVRTCPRRGGRAFSALLRFLFHEKLLSIFFTFTNA